jgi:chemotaxis protein MotB
MRAYRRPREAEEEESAFVSMTDMTVGFLFIVMLMMAFFATQFGATDTVPQELYETTLAERDAERAERERLAQRLAELQAERNRLREALSRAEARIAELERLLAQSDAARQALAERLTETEERLVALDAALAARADETSRLRSALLEIEARLQELQRQSDEAVAEGARRLAAAEAELRALRQALTRANERIAELERLLAQRDPRNPLEAYLSAAYDERRRLLEGLRAELVRLHPGILIEVSPEGDALRFQGEGLFATGSATLRPQALQIVQDLARLLDDGIACMTLADAGAPRPEGCAAGAIVEAVQIEGHTDTVGSAQSNLALSTQRANAAFVAMIAAAPALEQRRNLRGQPVPGVAGYGEMRLAVPTADNVNEPANRRIDIRILMQTPATVAEIETIRQRLREGR